MPYQMPNGKWRAKRMIQGMVKTKTCDTKKQAIKWEAEQEAALWVESQQTIPSVCLHDFANAYLNEVQERFARKTLNEKKLAFRQLFKTVNPNLLPEDLTLDMARQALGQILVASSGNQANKARKNLIAAWEWGKKYLSLPKENPFKEVEKYPADQKPRYVPPEKDFWKVYEKASPQDQVFLLLMLHTGARRSEVFRLTWDDIDLEGRKIRLSTRKTGHGGMEYNWVPMTEPLRDALAMHPPYPHTDLVFVDPDSGEPYTSRQHIMGKLCKRSGVKPFGFHAIRHLSATMMAYGGMEIPNVQGVLRHKNPNTTARYIKSLCVKPEKLDAIFGQRKRTPEVAASEVPKKAIGT